MEEKYKQSKKISSNIYFLFDNYLKEITIFIALILIIIMFSIIKPVFFNSNNFLSIIEIGAYTGIVAIGQFFVLLTGGIDLSVGSTVGLSGIITAFLMSNFSLNPVLTIIITLIIGVVIGLINGLIITKLRIVDFIVTLGTMFIVHGLILAMTQGYSIYKNINKNFLSITNNKYLGLSLPLLFFLILIIISHIILKYTILGRRMIATGGNKSAASLMGVSANKIKILSYMISGFLSSVVGILIVGSLKSGQPSAGDSFLFETILVVVLGGASLSGGQGTIIGVFLGAIFLQTLFGGLNMSGFPYYDQEIVKGAIFLIAVSFSSIISFRKREF